MAELAEDDVEVQEERLEQRWRAVIGDSDKAADLLATLQTDANVVDQSTKVAMRELSSIVAKLLSDDTALGAAGEIEHVTSVKSHGYSFYFQARTIQSLAEVKDLYIVAVSIPYSMQDDCDRVKYVIRDDERNIVGHISRRSGLVYATRLGRSMNMNALRTRLSVLVFSGMLSILNLGRVDRPTITPKPSCKSMRCVVMRIDEAAHAKMMLDRMVKEEEDRRNAFAAMPFSSLEDLFVTVPVPASVDPTPVPVPVPPTDLRDNLAD